MSKKNIHTGIRRIYMSVIYRCQELELQITQIAQLLMVWLLKQNTESRFPFNNIKQNGEKIKLSIFALLVVLESVMLSQVSNNIMEGYYSQKYYCRNMPICSKLLGQYYGLINYF